MSGERLTALEATFLELEDADPGAHMHIGAVLVFDPRPGGDSPLFEEVLVRVDERLDAFPRCRQRLSQPAPGRLTWPSWVEDDPLDLRAHVRHVALPEPGGEQDLLEWAEDFYAHRLDRERPLWELAFVEGLPGGRWAAALKVHHCVADGVGALALAGLLLDGFSAPGDAGPRRGFHLPGEAVVRAAGGLAVHPHQAWNRGRSLLELIVREEAVPASRTSLDAPLGKHRRLAVAEAALDDLRAIRGALGGTVNDVVLTCVAAGLRRLLLDRGERPPARGVRAMVPVDTRRPEDLLRPGNHVSSLFVPLPVAAEETAERHAAVVRATAAHKAAHETQAAEDVIALTGWIPPAMHGALARAVFTSRLFAVTVTNVAGPQTPLWAFDACLRRAIPLVPLASGHAVGAAVLSYDGTVCFSVQADRAAVPEVELVTAGIASELKALRALADARSAPAFS